MLVAWITSDYRMIIKNKIGRNNRCSCGIDKRIKKSYLNI